MKAQIKIWFFMALVPAFLRAAGADLHVYSSFADFSRGKLEHLSLWHDGRLTLAPQVTQVLDTGDPYVWCTASDSRGNLYIGTGNNGKVYRISPKGDSTLFFDAEESQVFALAINSRDRVFVATSPHGQIYQVDASGNKQMFCDTGQTYVWAMVFDHAGDLWVATGGKAQLLRIEPDGVKRIIVSSEAEHIRCLAIGPETVYAGTSRPGLVYCVKDNLPPFVLFDTEAEEVQSIALDPSGLVYAAATASAGPVSAFIQVISSQPGRGNVQEAVSIENEPGDMTESGAPEESMPAMTRSQLFVIDQDGYGRNLWKVELDEVQSLLWDGKGGILAGTGKNGRLYRVDLSGSVSLLLQVEASQISAIAQAPGEKLVLATCNMGRCYQLQTAGQRGRYESEPLDASSLSTWGALDWRGQGQVSFYTRSGNTQKPETTWSQWQSVRQDGNVLRIQSPPARFLQWRCDLEATVQTPEVHEVTVAFMQKNRAPEILDIQIHPANLFFDANEGGFRTDPGVTEPEPLPKADPKPGFRSVSWDFKDPNRDALCFSLFYRNQEESTWRRLVRNIDQRFYSWDTNQMADGAYELKIVANDSLLLPRGAGLKNEKTSALFIVDNTGPKIDAMQIKKQSGTFFLSFMICDVLSPLADTWISINAGGWQPVYPVDGLSDSLCEQFSLPLDAGNVNVEITVRTTDRLGNMSVARTATKGIQ